MRNASTVWIRRILRAGPIAATAATIAITVTPVSPVATDDLGGTEQGVPTSIDVLANDVPGHPDVPLAAATLTLLDGDEPVDRLFVDGEALVHELDRRGFAVASGSACTASTLEPSHVLAAMGVLTHGNVRVTLPLAAAVSGGDAARASGVRAFCDELPDAVATVRAQLGTDRL